MRLLFVTGSLTHGGAERHTITLINRLAHSEATLQRTQPVNSLCIRPRNLREDWASPGRDQELVEGFPLDTPALKLAHTHPPPIEVDGLDFMERACIDVLLVAERLGGTRNQCLNIVDNLADVIGNPSGRVGCVRTALKSDDLEFG